MKDFIQAQEKEEEKKCSMCDGKGGFSSSGEICETCIGKGFTPSDKTLEERFDSEIEKITDIYYGDDGYEKAKVFVSSNENRLFEEELFPETFFELSPEKVKSFIQQELTSATIKAKEIGFRTGYMIGVDTQIDWSYLDDERKQEIIEKAKSLGINLEEPKS